MASANRTMKRGSSAPMACAAPASGAEGDTEERLRVAAYFIYENNGRRQGHSLEDWFAAQAQLGMRPTASSSDAPPKT